MANFTCNIRTSRDKEFHVVLVGLNYEDTFVQTRDNHKKASLKKLCKSWFPDAVIIDETKKKV